MMMETPSLKVLSPFSSVLYVTIVSEDVLSFF
jgi:hypothetical protein